MKKAIIGIIVVITMVVLGFSAYMILRPKYLVLQGVANATEIRISSRVMGRVDQLYVKEGDSVKMGDLLVTIDAPDLKAKALQASSVRSAASAQSQKADTGARPEEIESAFNIWQKAKIDEKVLQQTNTRIQQLFKDGVVPAQQSDEAQARYDAAVKGRLAVEAQYQVAVRGARVEDKDAASAVLSQADGAVQELQSYLDDTVLKSPIDGEVSIVVLSKGELAGSGAPLITLTDLSDVYFVFNIREDLMPNFTMGKQFEVSIPALDPTKKYKLQISYISPRGDFSTWSATKSSGQFDLRSFEVRARAVESLPNLRPGMSANFDIKR